MIRTCLSVAAVTVCLGAQSVPAMAQGADPARSTAKAAAASVININTASATDLEALPGIGAKTAARIVEYRQKNGPFKRIEELMNIRGVGEKSFLKLRPQITVAGRKPEQNKSQQ